MSMKSFVLASCLMIGVQSFANVEVIESPIKGKAMKGLYGIIQIFSPYITTPQNNTDLRLKADATTANAACMMLDKKLHNYRSTDAVSTYYASLDGYGVLSIESDGRADSSSYGALKPDAIIDLLVCK